MAIYPQFFVFVLCQDLVIGLESIPKGDRTKSKLEHKSTIPNTFSLFILYLIYTRSADSVNCSISYSPFSL